MKELIKYFESNVGMLRQWLNEDRIKEPSKIVTNKQLLFWLSPDSLINKIKTDLLKIADNGEYEDMRREVERYFKN